MPRSSRILIKNAYYHVMARGNQKMSVFHQEDDYFVYLRLARRYKEKYDIKIFGYCLMPNHIHMALKPNYEDSLSTFMQCLNQSYAIRFNFKYGKCGHLWQGRFKSLVIKSVDYLIECIEYIERNPVRAHLADSVDRYKWSSYRFRLLNERDLACDSLVSIEGRDVFCPELKSVPKKEIWGHS